MKLPLLHLGLTLLLTAGAWAQAPPDCPGTCTTTTTAPGFPPVMLPGEREGENGEGQGEEPVGDFSDWLTKNPGSPLANLAGQTQNDPQLQGVLNQLTGSELKNLGNLLTTYQTAINNYVAAHPRTWDTAGGGLRNFLNSLSALGGGDPYTRGCADMAEQAISALGPKTGGSQPFTVHGYNWVPGGARQYGAYFGTPVVMIVVVKSAGAGTAMAGPLGTVVGGTAGLAIALGSGSTEHNMAAIQSTRNPKLIIVLDPHGAQNGNPESVHGPGHYTGVTGSPELGPPRTPAAAPASGTPTIERGSVK